MVEGVKGLRANPGTLLDQPEAESLVGSKHALDVIYGTLPLFIEVADLQGFLGLCTQSRKNYEEIFKVKQGLLASAFQKLSTKLDALRDGRDIQVSNGGGHLDFQCPPDPDKIYHLHAKFAYQEGNKADDPSTWKLTDSEGGDYFVWDKLPEEDLVGLELSRVFARAQESLPREFYDLALPVIGRCRFFLSLEVSIVQEFELLSEFLQRCNQPDVYTISYKLGDHPTYQIACLKPLAHRLIPLLIRFTEHTRMVNNHTAFTAAVAREQSNDSQKNCKQSILEQHRKWKHTLPTPSSPPRSRQTEIALARMPRLNIDRVRDASDGADGLSDAELSLLFGPLS
jgi:hypothetical protein